MILTKAARPEFRARKAFALFPRATKDGRVIWLENIFIREQREKGCSYGGCWDYYRIFELLPWKEATYND